MVDITSLKVRLARLRLGSEFDDKNPELADPVTIERKKKKKQKKAAQDPYNEYTTNTGGKRKKKNKLTRSDQKRARTLDDGTNQKYEEEDGGYSDVDHDWISKRKKNNKLTHSDKKRP